MMVPLTDVFLFESHYSSDVFAKNICNPGKKAVVNYNGVDLPSVTSSKIYQPGQLLNLASFGLLRHLKGHDILIETCFLLKQKNIPFNYFIYGAGDFEVTLNGLIKKYDLENEVKILSYATDVCIEMLKYDYIVHPSRYESFGYVPVEAMSVKIPVVVSHEGGLQEVVDPSSGYISYDNTPESYLKIFNKIFIGDEGLELKINTAYEKVKTLFSKKTMVQNIRKFYFE
jgi:glycosyltransferase involved in cell wall biosynthesis